MGSPDQEGSWVGGVEEEMGGTGGKGGSSLPPLILKLKRLQTTFKYGAKLNYYSTL